MADARADDADVAADAEVAGRYRLRLQGRHPHGRLGARRSRAAGGSQEFLDFRDYAPGDDVRHVDWHGFARSGELRVRQYEAEVAPRLDLVVDTSPSMAVTAAKAAAVRQLVAALRTWARLEGTAARVTCLGGEAVDPADLPLGDGPVLPTLPRVPLRHGSVRVLLTDALWSTSPRALLHGLAAGAGHFVCLQLLDPWELAPTPGEVLAMVDVETGERVERVLDAALLAGYQASLQRLGDELRASVNGCGGVHALVVATDLAGMCAQALLPAGLVEPA